MNRPQDFCQAEFVSPKKENNVVYTWVWNQPVNKQIIDEQMEAFAEAGIGGVYVLPLPDNFRPKTMRSNMKPDYLGDEYFECVKYAMEKGDRLGMELWIYDEGGWPSGGACGKTVREIPEAKETLLCKRSVTLAKGETYVPSPDTVSAFVGKARIYGGYTADHADCVNEYYTAKSADDHPNRVDSTNKRVIDAFINNTYKRHQQALGDTFGKASAFFTDEPSVIPRLIPENFFTLFFETYGYRAEDFLYCLESADLAESAAERMARIHYGRLLGDLFYNNYCKNIGNWCRENGIRFAGHLDLDHLADGGSKQCYFSHLRALGEFDIPGIDVIWHQIRIPAEGESAVSEGVSFYPRLASSVAHQTGKNLALTESFGVYGDGVTPDEIRYVLNYQAIRGINLFNMMLMASGRDEMSSLLERPVFSPNKPGFYSLAHLNRYFARLGYLLKLGEPQIDTALYVPCADFWASSEVSARTAEAYAAAGDSLEKQNIEFDIVDDYAIMSAEATDCGLRVGKMTYRRVVVPACEFMPQEIREKLFPYCEPPSDPSQNCPVTVMKRKLSSGMLYFAFNHTDTRQRGVLSIPNDAPLYRLNVADGEIYSLSEAKFDLPCGDMAVFYASQKLLRTVADEIEYSVTLSDFKAVDVKRFVVTKQGIAMVPSDLEAAQSNAFSGEVTYRAEYRLPGDPARGERYRILLKNTSVSAVIRVDGRKIATVGLAPMQATVDGECLRRQGTIEITVANTAGNEIVAKDSVILSHPAEVVGPYHKKSLIYEKLAPPLHFGEALIQKMK